MGSGVRSQVRVGKFRVTREWSDIETASSARVTLDHSGRWFVSFTRLAQQMERKSTGSVIGIDMGIAITVATSEGKSLKPQKLLTKGQRQRRRRLQRKLARQVKGSNRYRVTKLAIAKLAAKEVDRRKDWIEKITTDLVHDYDLISLEALKIKNMTKSAKGTKDKPGKNVAQKSGLNRSVLEQGWGMFRRRLTDKAINAITPVEIIAINPACTGLAVTERGGTSHIVSNKTQHSDPVKRTTTPKAA
ncbi:transposase [Ferrimicrobium sp.]|uniref:RNA-guided endonuclease InsQ/TnpB family protein n=1 Tax=Ferrimicrobium sp. TaxID=2926050 RepID=UPI00262F3B5E|nr:transposase [Ferrimicrobium sp.]